MTDITRELDCKLCGPVTLHGTEDAPPSADDHLRSPEHREAQRRELRPPGFTGEGWPEDIKTPEDKLVIDTPESRTRKPKRWWQVWR